MSSFGYLFYPQPMQVENELLIYHANAIVQRFSFSIFIFLNAHLIRLVHASCDGQVFRCFSFCWNNGDQIAIVNVILFLHKWTNVMNLMQLPQNKIRNNDFIVVL